METEMHTAAGAFRPLDQSKLVAPNEATLFIILAVFATLLWLIIIVGTLGVALLYALMFFVIYLFSHSAFIAHLRGNAVEVTAEQFPDLHRRVRDCCERLGMRETPRTYIWAADGMLNALATRFLNRNYVVLMSSVVDALQSKPEAINFYIGHELGHIRQNHLAKAPFLALVSWLPLIGPAYSRACETTCDLHGLRCVDSTEAATSAMAVLAAGIEQWRHLSVAQYIKQANDARGFWMSYHELTNDYPWLAKRIARVVAASQGQTYRAASRNPLAYLFALFTPRVYGGASSLFIVVFIIGIMAAIALPAYQGYVEKSRQEPGSLESWDGEYGDGSELSNPGSPEQAQVELDNLYNAAQPILQAMSDYRASHEGQWPASFDDIDISDETWQSFGNRLEYYGNGKIGFYGQDSLGDYQSQPVYIEPVMDEESGELTGWHCSSWTIPDSYLPPQCQG